MIWVLSASLLAALLASGLALSSRSERLIASAHARVTYLAHAADASAELAAALVARSEDWQALPDSLPLPGGPGVVPADIAALTGAMNQRLATRFPRGADTPVWQVAGTWEEAGTRLVVWLTTEPSDDGERRVVVRARAGLPPRQTRTVDIHMLRTPEGTRRLSWREVW